MGESDVKFFTEEEVAQHNTKEDCWCIIGEVGSKKVYNITNFLDDHPGGPEILEDEAGRDATEAFEDIGHSQDARDDLVNYFVGNLKEDPEAAAAQAKKIEAEKVAGGGDGDTMLIAVAGIFAVGAIAYMALF